MLLLFLGFFGFCKRVGGLSDFLHGFDVLAHGFHPQIQAVFMGGLAFDLGPPFLRRDCFVHRMLSGHRNM